MKYYKVCEMILIWALILSGCASPYPITSDQVLALQPKYTADSVQAILQGTNPLAQAFSNGDGLYFLAWPGPGNMWSGACLQMHCPEWMAQFKYFAGGQGEAMTPEGIGALARGLVAAGWTKVSPALIAVPGLVTIPIFPLIPQMIAQPTSVQL